MTVKMTAPVAPNGKGLGWRPDLPDFRDYPLTKRMSIRDAMGLARKASFRDKMSPVRDQGDSNACTGFSTAAAISYLRTKDKDPRNPEHSALFSYYMGRFLEDEVNLTWTKLDQGAYIRLVVKGINKFGSPPETKWPLNFKKMFSKPTLTAYKEANRWKLGNYYRCANGLEVLNALAAGFPVVGGFSCYSSMFTPEVQASGNVPMPDKSDVFFGGHAVCFVGYDQDAGRITFKNSWGPEWGDKGYGTLPLAFLNDSNLCDDMWALAGEEVVSPTK